MLPKLRSLRLDTNALTGTLPACMGNIATLEGLFVATNQLEGTLPASLGNLSNMLNIGVDQNLFTGTIPGTFCDMRKIASIAIDQNILTGTLPACLASCPELRHLTMLVNQIEGTIPPGIWQLPKMVTFWTAFNYFTGPIGDFRGQRNLTQLVLCNNYLTGTVPDSFGYTPRLEVLYINNNLFSGSLPASLGNLAAGEIISLSVNLFTGTVPALTGMLGAFQLDLGNNHLSGSLDGVFDASTQVAMLDVFLNDNQLTGTLPDELFRLPKLNTIVAQGNCFTGTLSAAMCESPAMMSLILDGLHTSTACRRELLSATRSYTTGSDVHGTIPACLFGLATLVSLHLAGNGLTGTLPAVDSITPRLVDLTVSHNYLTGTIPAIIQAHLWKTLDLSYNRLTGGLESALGTAFADKPGFVSNVTERSLSVQNNRLSGRIPSSVVHLQNVSVLGSNMFACKIDKSDLPKHDSDHDNYQCGSDAFNAPFYVVLALIIVVLCVLALVLHLPHPSSTLAAIKSAVERWRSSAVQLPPNAHAVLLVSEILCCTALCCTALILLLLVPWYVAASSSGYSTYTYEYAWAVSAAFLSGVTPFVTEFVLFGVILLATVASTFYLINNAGGLRSDTADPRFSVSDPAEPHKLPMWHRVIVYAAFLVVNKYRGGSRGQRGLCRHRTHAKQRGGDRRAAAAVRLQAAVEHRRHTQAYRNRHTLPDAVREKTRDQFDDCAGVPRLVQQHRHPLPGGGGAEPQLLLRSVRRGTRRDVEVCHRQMSALPPSSGVFRAHYCRVNVLVQPALPLQLSVQLEFHHLLRAGLRVPGPGRRICCALPGPGEAVAVPVPRLKWYRLAAQQTWSLHSTHPKPSGLDGQG
jgi:Leucine-rich repeat (LRR) protein